MAGVANDIIDRLQQLTANRVSFETAWRQVSAVAAPEASEFNFGATSSNMLGGLGQRPLAADRSKDIYDSTAVNAVDRLASGIEALVIPQSEYWHGLGVAEIMRDDLSDEEKLFLERVRNGMFKMRYDADSGWVSASQTAIRRCVAFGNAFFWTEEGFDNRAIVRYRYLPLNECFVAENHFGVIDTFYRLYDYTARQALQKFGDKCSSEIKKAAESPTDKDKPFRFVHAIHPRGEFGSGNDVLNAPFESVQIEYNSKTVVQTRGYYEFPVIDFRWLPEPGRVYGEGPVMKVLADIQSLNLMAKNELVANQQAIDPPLLVAHAGVMNRPNTNPGAINFGGMSPSGEPLIKPLFTGQRLDFATMVLEAKRAQVKESMYLNLFALLVQSPQMSATEAMIRANEKGELLGPAGARLQQGLSRMIERELGIIGRRGMFGRGKLFEVPGGMLDKTPTAQMTSPLDRLRRAKEGEGTMRLLEMASPLAQIDPEVLDTIDPDETVRGMSDILGVPIKFMRTKEAVAKRRAERQQAQAAQINAQIAEQLAAASAQGTNALKNAKQAGMV